MMVRMTKFTTGRCDTCGTYYGLGLGWKVLGGRCGDLSLQPAAGPFNGCRGTVRRVKDVAIPADVFGPPGRRIRYVVDGGG